MHKGSLFGSVLDAQWNVTEEKNKLNSMRSFVYYKWSISHKWGTVVIKWLLNYNMSIYKSL